MKGHGQLYFLMTSFHPKTLLRGDRTAIYAKNDKLPVKNPGYEENYI